MQRTFFGLNLFLLAQLVAGMATAGELKIAVASNFAVTARALVEEYSLISDDSISLLIGSTGKHASQIQYGLPVDVFLAADKERPELLEKKGIAIQGSRFTYAVGRLVLWSRDPLLVDDMGAVLRSTNYKYLAIANPKTAPYGVAAKELLSGMDLTPNLVFGESVGQAYQFASSGSAQLALIAYSQIKTLDSGSYWLVPVDRYQAIEQQAVLLTNTRSAKNFVRFLQSESARSLITSHGYLTSTNPILN